MPGATLLWAALATATGAGLFLIKYEVQTEERHLRALQREIAETEQSIHVLHAEWSYLNDPERLRGEAERNLGMHAMQPRQMVHIKQLATAGHDTTAQPEPSPATPPEAAVRPPPPPPPRPHVAPKSSAPPAHALTASRQPVHKAHPSNADPQIAAMRFRP
jgi:hypothetical protein